MWIQQESVTLTGRRTGHTVRTLHGMTGGGQQPKPLDAGGDEKAQAQKHRPAGGGFPHSQGESTAQEIQAGGMCWFDDRGRL